GLVGQSLTLQLDTPTFSPPNDGRVLGLIGLEARAKEVGSIGWWPGPTLPLPLLGLLALLLAHGPPPARAVLGAALTLAATLAIGLIVPTETLAAAGTLAQLLFIAAAVVGIAQWLRWRRRGGQAADHAWWLPGAGRGWRWVAALMLLLA